MRFLLSIRCEIPSLGTVVRLSRRAEDSQAQNALVSEARSIEHGARTLEALPKPCSQGRSSTGKLVITSWMHFWSYLEAWSVDGLCLKNELLGRGRWLESEQGIPLNGTYEVDSAALPNATRGCLPRRLAIRLDQPTGLVSLHQDFYRGWYTRTILF